MHWIISGILVATLIGIYFKTIELYSKNYLKTFELSFFFSRLMFSAIGLVCFISLLFSFKYSKNKNIQKKIFNKKTGIVIVFLSLLYLVYLYFLNICLKKAGNYTFVIMNLNILIIFMIGYFFFKEKMNFKTLLFLILFIISGGYLCLNKN